MVSDFVFDGDPLGLPYNSSRGYPKLERLVCGKQEKVDLKQNSAMHNWDCVEREIV